MKRKSLEKPAAGSATPVEEPRTPPWSPLTRIAFRFSFLYFGLFCLATQLSGSLFLTPTSSFRGFGTLWPMRAITSWVVAHLFGVTDPLVYGRNSGETLF